MSVPIAWWNYSANDIHKETVIRSVWVSLFFSLQVSLINHARYGGSGNVIGHVLRKGANFGFPSQVGHVGYGKGGWQCWLTRLYPADPIGCLFLEHSCGSFPGEYWSNFECFFLCLLFYSLILWLCLFSLLVDWIWFMFVLPRFQHMYLSPPKKEKEQKEENPDILSHHTACFCHSIGTGRFIASLSSERVRGWPGDRRTSTLAPMMIDNVAIHG